MLQNVSVHSLIPVGLENWTRHSERMLCFAVYQQQRKHYHHRPGRYWQKLPCTRCIGSFICSIKRNDHARLFDHAQKCQVEGKITSRGYTKHVYSSLMTFDPPFKKGVTIGCNRFCTSELPQLSTCPVDGWHELIGEGLSPTILEELLQHKNIDGLHEKKFYTVMYP